MTEIETYCGLQCSGCAFRESHACGGCIKTKGNPFHGECPVAKCCQAKGHVHCGECDEIPCEKLYAYSYLDPEHGDKPQGARVMQCRQWAAERNIHKWHNVLLTDAGFYNIRNLNQPLTAIIDKFAEMLGKPFGEAKVLFIPSAAQKDEEAKKIAALLKDELTWLGIKQENITIHDIDGTMTEAQAMSHDAIIFSGGWDAYLLERIKATDYDRIIKKMVYANKVYVGQSAGTVVASPNIRGCFGGVYDKDYSALCLVNAYIDVHCNYKPDLTPKELPLPHIMLCDHQALAVSWEGYELVEEISAKHDGLSTEPPSLG